MEGRDQTWSTLAEHKDQKRTPFLFLEHDADVVGCSEPALGIPEHTGQPPSWVGERGPFHVAFDFAGFSSFPHLCQTTS